MTPGMKMLTPNESKQGPASVSLSHCDLQSDAYEPGSSAFNTPTCLVPNAVVRWGTRPRLWGAVAGVLEASGLTTPI